eukprot:gene23716-32096_t
MLTGDIAIYLNLIYCEIISIDDGSSARRFTMCPSTSIFEGGSQLSPRRTPSQISHTSIYCFARRRLTKIGQPSGRNSRRRILSCWTQLIQEHAPAENWTQDSIKEFVSKAGCEEARALKNTVEGRGEDADNNDYNTDGIQRMVIDEIHHCEQPGDGDGADSWPHFSETLSQ